MIRYPMEALATAGLSDCTHAWLPFRSLTDGILSLYPTLPCFCWKSLFLAWLTKTDTFCVPGGRTYAASNLRKILRKSNDIRSIHLAELGHIPRSGSEFSSIRLSVDVENWRYLIPAENAVWSFLRIRRCDHINHPSSLGLRSRSSFLSSFNTSLPCPSVSAILCRACAVGLV